MIILNQASEAYKLLNGVFCIYKPSGISSKRVQEMVVYTLSRDLNLMELREPRIHVAIKGSLSNANSKLTVVAEPSLADTPLVVGPRYQEQDFRVNYVNYLGKFSSGLMLLGIGDGCRLASKIKEGSILRKFEINARFGLATENFLADGKVIGKATFKNVTQTKVDSILASVQAAHQANAFKFSGLRLDTQAAYEIASAGLVRPEGYTLPLFYKLICTKFDSPDFTIEAVVVNESEDFMAQFIHELGLRLHTYAICTKIRSTSYGPFNLDYALVRKHWGINNIIQNISHCREKSILKNILPKSPLLNINKVE